MKVLVDIVIPTFNRSDVLNRAIRSVFHQSFQSFNLWVVDDGSTDETQKILHQWRHFSQMKVLSSSVNRGVSAARNAGVEAGRAEWVAFLDSDDEWMPEKLTTQVEQAQKNSQHPLIHTNEIWIRNGTKLNQKKKHRKKGGRLFKESLSLCCISPSSAFIQRKVFQEIGLFREDFPVCEDYEMWLRISSRWEVGFIQKPLIIKYGGHGDQLSRKYKAMDEWRVRAMYGYLHSQRITQEERKELVRVLINKCRILLNGYRKHNNYTNEKEIQKIYEKTLSLVHILGLNRNDVAEYG